jgi:Subtilase family
MNKTLPPIHRNLRPLWQSVPIALIGLALASCTQSPIANVGETGVMDSRFTMTVQIGSNATAAQLEQKYAGRVVSWHPEAGFAILGVNARPASTDPAIKGIDENAGTLKAPVVATTNRVDLTPQGNAVSAESAWMGGWTSWSGGWTSWSGGWTSWSGGSSIPSLPAENTVAFSQIRLPQAQAISRNFGAGIKVAVIDTGLDLTHPAFVGRLAPANEWKDFVDGDATPQEVGTTANAGFGHGTGVAGIILQVAPKATILPLRVLDQNGAGDLDNVVAAIDWAVANGAQVINLSLGSVQNQTSLITELEYVASKKVYVVASAGNNAALDGITYPAATSEWGALNGYVFGIASVNSNDILSSFSNYGNGLFGVVPGEAIYSTFPGNRTASFTGTSFAAPIFTGALALGLKELPAGVPSTDFKKYMINSVRAGQIFTENIDARGTSALGYGRLDIESMIRNLPNWTPKANYGATNLISNPAFSNNGAGWNKLGIGNSSVVSDGGQTAVQIGSGAGFYQYITGLQPNTTYTFSARMRGNVGSEGMTLNVGGFGAKNMLIYPKGITYAPRSVTFTTGPSNTSAAVELSNSGSQAIYAYDISLRQTGY